MARRFNVFRAQRLPDCLPRPSKNRAMGPKRPKGRNSRAETMASEGPSIPKTDEQAFELDRVWLRFRDPSVEHVFEHDTLRQSINFIRAYLIAGTCLYILFGILDSVVGGA